MVVPWLFNLTRIIVSCQVKGYFVTPLKRRRRSEKDNQKNCALSETHSQIDKYSR